MAHKILGIKTALDVDSVAPKYKSVSNVSATTFIIIGICYYANLQSCTRKRWLSTSCRTHVRSPSYSWDVWEIVG